VRRLLLVACVGCSDPAAKPDAGVSDAQVSVLSITPGAFDFGDHELGTDPLPPPLAISIKNIGGQPLDLTSIALGGPDAADYVIPTNGCGASLGPDEACELDVVFDPHGANLRAAQLDVTTPLEIVSVPLRGTGFVEGLKVLFDPPATTFGDLAAGTTSANATISVLNEAVAATFTTSIVDRDASSFHVVSTTCNAAIPLHGTCEVVVSMTAAWAGQYIGTLKLSAGSAGTWGTGLTPTSTNPITMAPFSDTYGGRPRGHAEPGALREFTVKNTSSATTGTLTPTLSGAGASAYTIESNDCTTLAANATCTIDVRLTATTRGTKLADLVVTDGASNIEARSALFGSGYTVLISTPPQFTATTVGQTTQKTFTLLNASDRDTGNLTIDITGADYAIVNTSTCATGIAAHSMCTVQVAFSPSATGTRTATLQASASPGGSDSVTLTGTGQ